VGEAWPEPAASRARTRVSFVERDSLATRHLIASPRSQLSMLASPNGRASSEATRPRGRALRPPLSWLVSGGTGLSPQRKDKAPTLSRRLVLWAQQGSNLRPLGCDPNALPAELCARVRYCSTSLVRKGETREPLGATWTGWATSLNQERRDSLAARRRTPSGHQASNFAFSNMSDRLSPRRFRVISTNPSPVMSTKSADTRSFFNSSRTLSMICCTC
jgi:hypothetical protein